MSDTSIEERQQEARSRGSTQSRGGSAAPACCGLAMQLELALARRRDGTTFYAAVWVCARCGRIKL